MNRFCGGHFILALILAFLSLDLKAQDVSKDGLEQKVKADLESSISKMLDPNQFAVQVSAIVERSLERQVVEGEQLVQNLPATKAVSMPPLPGFDPPPRSAEAPPGHSRQVFKSVERNSLKSISVILSLDKALSEEESASAESFARSYLANSYPSQSSLSLAKISMRQQKTKEDSLLTKAFSKDFFPWIAVGLVVLTLLGFLIWALKVITRSNGHSPRLPARSVGPYLDQPGEEFRSNLVPNLESERSPLLPALNSKRLELGERQPAERSAFGGIPTNPQYADQRRELLDSFLANSKQFRVYYKKLDDLAKTEICKALSGPAFDTLLESLSLEKQDVGLPAPSEEQIQFYLKNFSEFRGALDWQDQQFFGFLANMTDNQLASLIRLQNPVVGALILKYCKAETSAQVLDRMSDKDRKGVIDQFERVGDISAAELKSIETSIRSSLSTMPDFIADSSSQELDYWSKLLAAAKSPQAILINLEHARPDLYEKLARFRFQLTDIASLPPPLVRKVLDEVENDELAKAFSRMSPDLIKYSLSELPEARRRLLLGQILSYQNLEGNQVNESIQNLTRKFREVLV